MYGGPPRPRPHPWPWPRQPPRELLTQGESNLKSTKDRAKAGRWYWYWYWAACWRGGDGVGRGGRIGRGACTPSAAPEEHLRYPTAPTELLQDRALASTCAPTRHQTKAGEGRSMQMRHKGDRAR